MGLGGLAAMNAIVRGVRGKQKRQNCFGSDSFLPFRQP
jgi:hypothetical protein